MQDSNELIKLFNIMNILRGESGYKQKRYVCTPMLKLAVIMVKLNNGISKQSDFLINMFKTTLEEEENDNNKKSAVREFLIKALEIAIKDNEKVPYVIMVIKHYIKMYVYVYRIDWKIRVIIRD